MLATEHKADDDELNAVYWAPHPEEVRLIEVTGSISDRGEILPFRFTPDPPDVPYQSVIILLSPADWERRRELEWPAGYGVDDLEKVA